MKRHKPIQVTSKKTMVGTRVITFYMDLKKFTSHELKQCLKNKDYLNIETYTKIQEELLRRGEGYFKY